jgi:hypothetical protein
MREFLEKYQGYSETGIVQRRAEPVRRGSKEWALTDDKYITFSNPAGLIVNVRVRGGQILEVYPGDYKKNWKNPEGLWSARYGFSPAGLSWPKLDPVDYYLTCEGLDDRWATEDFFRRFEFVTPRWSAKGLRFNMVYGSCTPGFETEDETVKLLFAQYPKTKFLSVYFEPNRLDEPRAALVIGE